MASRLLVGAVCASVVLAAAGAAGSARNQTSPAGLGVVFSVFENLPPRGACPGLYVVDASTRRMSWIGGWDARRDEGGLYPAFTAAGRLSYGHFDDASATGPLVVVVRAGEREFARAFLFSGWAWSPRREELAYGRLQDRRTVELVLASGSGSGRVLAPSMTSGLSWLPDGSGLVYGRAAAKTDVIAFVRRDGGGRRDLVRDGTMPLVSPDGRWVAFTRKASPRPGIVRPELWVVPARGGPARRVVRGSSLPENMLALTWLSSREILVQRGGKNRDPFFDARDNVLAVDVRTGRARQFLARAFALSISPDRRHVLFVRPQRDSGGEGYFSIRTVRVDGKGERLLAVTDQEDLNIRSLPVWKPAGVEVGWVGDAIPNAPTEATCVALVTSLRDRTR